MSSNSDVQQYMQALAQYQANALSTNVLTYQYNNNIAQLGTVSESVGFGEIGSTFLPLNILNFPMAFENNDLVSLAAMLNGVSALGGLINSVQATMNTCYENCMSTTQAQQIVQQVNTINTLASTSPFINASTKDDITSAVSEIKDAFGGTWPPTSSSPNETIPQSQLENMRNYFDNNIYVSTNPAEYDGQGPTPSAGMNSLTNAFTSLSASVNTTTQTLNTQVSFSSSEDSSYESFYSSWVLSLLGGVNGVMVNNQNSS